DFWSLHIRTIYRLRLAVGYRWLVKCWDSAFVVFVRYFQLRQGGLHGGHDVSAVEPAPRQEAVKPSARHLRLQAAQAARSAPRKRQRRLSLVNPFVLGNGRNGGLRDISCDAHACELLLHSAAAGMAGGEPGARDLEGKLLVIEEALLCQTRDGLCYCTRLVACALEPPLQFHGSTVSHGEKCDRLVVRSEYQALIGQCVAEPFVEHPTRGERQLAHHGGGNDGDRRSRRNYPVAPREPRMRKDVINCIPDRDSLEDIGFLFGAALLGSCRGAPSASVVHGSPLRVRASRGCAEGRSSTLRPTRGTGPRRER